MQIAKDYTCIPTQVKFQLKSMTAFHEAHRFNPFVRFSHIGIEKGTSHLCKIGFSWLYTQPLNWTQEETEKFEPYSKTCSLEALSLNSTP